jgi:hypothetical protein
MKSRKYLLVYLIFSSLAEITPIDDSIIIADSPENKLYQLNENLELIRTIQKNK